MTFERNLISRYLPHLLPPERAPGRSDEALDTALLCAATAAVVRVDERLKGASAAVRAGWMARALLHEAMASARLDGAFAETRDLLLMDHHALDRLVDQPTQRAYQGLQLLRAVSRRHPRQLFTPRRLMATVRLRLRSRTDTQANPEWLQERRADLSEVQAALAKALDPAALSRLRTRPALQGAFEFLALWHRCGAAGLLGGVGGRALASAWLRRVGLTDEASCMTSIGFLGHASDYQPLDRRRWPAHFLEATLRASDWQLSLLERLARAERRFAELMKPSRSTSQIPRLADFVISFPAVSARAASEVLGLTQTTVRRALAEFEHAKLVQEITGRDAFRLYAEAQAPA